MNIYVVCLIDFNLENLVPLHSRRRKSDYPLRRRKFVGKFIGPFVTRVEKGENV